MNVTNTLTAKVIGEIIAEGMSISDVNLKEETEMEAINILEKIINVFSQKTKSDEKVKKVEQILEENGLK